MSVLSSTFLCVFAICSLACSETAFICISSLILIAEGKDQNISFLFTWVLQNTLFKKEASHLFCCYKRKMCRWAICKAPCWLKPINTIQIATFFPLQLILTFFPLSISSSLFQSLRSLSRHLSTFPWVTFATFNIFCWQEYVPFSENLEEKYSSS